MGGIILLGLVGLAIFIFLTPSFREGARRRRDEIQRAAREAVARRLEDQRPSKSSTDAPPHAPPSKGDGDDPWKGID